MNGRVHAKTVGELQGGECRDAQDVPEITIRQETPACRNERRVRRGDAPFELVRQLERVAGRQRQARRRGRGEEGLESDVNVHLAVADGEVGEMVRIVGGAGREPHGREQRRAERRGIENPDPQTQTRLDITDLRRTHEFQRRRAEPVRLVGKERVDPLGSDGLGRQRERRAHRGRPELRQFGGHGRDLLENGHTRRRGGQRRER